MVEEEVTLVLGIDPSAKKIAIVGTETTLNVQHAEAFMLYKGTSKQTPESIYEAMVAMRGYLAGIHGLLSVSQKVAYVESPLVGRGGTTTTIKQAYVGGVIRACLVEAGFTVYDVNQSSWKKHLGVRSRGTANQKADVARAVKIRWPKVQPVVEGDGDLTDAAGICIYGTDQVAKANSLDSDAIAAASVVQGKRPRTVVRTSHLRP